MHRDHNTADELRDYLKTGHVHEFLKKKIDLMLDIHKTIKATLNSSTFTSAHIMLAQHLNIKHPNAKRSVDSREIGWWPPEHYRKLCVSGTLEDMTEARAMGLVFAWWHNATKTREDFYNALDLCHPLALNGLAKMCKGTPARILVIYLMMLLGDRKAEADYAYHINKPDHLRSMGDPYALLRYYDIVGGRIDQYWNLVIDGCKKAYKRVGMLQLENGEYETAAATFGKHYPKLARHAGIRNATYGTIDIKHCQKYIIVSISRDTTQKDFNTAALHLKDALRLMFIAPESYSTLISVRFKDTEHVIYT